MTYEYLFNKLSSNKIFNGFLFQIDARLRQNLDDKKQKALHVGVGVTPEGQRVFNSIVKT